MSWVDASRARLNENRSYAQESQGKRALLQKVRIGAARDLEAIGIHERIELGGPVPDGVPR